MVTRSGNFKLIIFLLFVGALHITKATITGWTNPPGAGAIVAAAATPTIAENLKTGTSTRVTIAASGKAGGGVSYAIRSQPAAGKLTIASATGKLSLAVGTFDFETEPTYVLTIIATDSDSTTGTATVTLSITDVNEPPVFASSQYSATVLDNSTGGTSVITVSAFDVDAGDKITYSIKDGNTNNDFAIDGTTGAITVAPGKRLNLKTLAKYALKIIATDLLGSSDLTDVLISVIDYVFGSGAGMVVASLLSLFVALSVVGY